MPAGNDFNNQQIKQQAQYLNMRGAQIAEQSRAVQAFYALRDGLYDGMEITEAISGSYEVLTGEGR